MTEFTGHQLEVAEQVLAGLRELLGREPTFDDFRQLDFMRQKLEDASIEIVDGRDPEVEGQMSQPLLQEELQPGDRVLFMGWLPGTVRPWVFNDEPYVPWGVYVLFDGHVLLNFIHVGHLEKL